MQLRIKNKKSRSIYKVNKLTFMKRPYLTQVERIYIYYNTTIGSLAMLRFRWMQLGKCIYKALPKWSKYLIN